MTNKVMNKSKKKSDESPVSKAFSSFPKNLLNKKKADIMKKADISESTFYRILSGFRPKGPVRVIFCEILKQKDEILFPVIVTK